MAAFTTSPRNAMLDWLVGNADPAATATRYITTFNGDPQGAGTENISTLTGSSNRIDLTTAMAAAASAQAVNDAIITFTSNANGNASVNYVAVYDAITAGNLLASAQVTQKDVTTGDSLTIQVGNCVFEIQ